MATDAFGRLRTSDVHTLFEYYPNLETQNTNIDIDIWVNDETNSASIGYNSGTNIVELQGNTNNDIATRSTKLPMKYQPGKSRLLYMSCVPLSRAIADGEVFYSRFGIFSVDGSKNPIQGHYFETNGTNLYFVYTYGGTETKIIQSNWNIDTFNGNGPSGKTLTTANMLNTILIVIDQEWLGVGRVRVGFNIFGTNYYAHEFNTSVSLSYPYTTTPRLPITYQMKTTTISSPIFLGQICSTCLSEGGFIPIGRRISIGNPVSGANVPDANQKYIILGVRINSSYPTGILDILDMDVFFPSGSTTKWAEVELQLHSTNGSIGATTGGTISFTNQTNSIIQTFKQVSGSGNNPYISTDGFIITKKFLLQKSQINLSSTDYSIQLTRTQISQYDTLYVSIKMNSGTNSTAGASIDFIEST